MGKFGSSLSNGVRLDQYYPTTHAVDPYHLARKATFGDYIPPSTSVIMEHGLHHETAISTSLIAVTPSRSTASTGSIRRMSMHLKRPGSCRRSPATILSSSPDRWRLPNLGGLDPRAHASDVDRWGGSEIRKQTEFLILNKLKVALEAAGSSLTQAVKAQVYVKIRLASFPILSMFGTHTSMKSLARSRSCRRRLSARSAASSRSISLG